MFESFAKEFPSKMYFSIYLEDVVLRNVDLLLSYIMIQEFLLLFKV